MAIYVITLKKNDTKNKVILPGNFNPENHFYPKVLNAQLHATVAYFFNLSKERIIQRFCHLNPQTKPSDLENILSYQARYFYWAGGDLFHTTTSAGTRKMVILETNSSPSGQKSMPLLNETQEQGGYYFLIKESFLPLLNKHSKVAGKIAVVYDKNEMEASAYASVIADLTGEEVFLTQYYQSENNKHIRFKNNVLQIKSGGTWINMRGVFRYLTQKPWNRLPVFSKTFIFNPILACLAGGRNKLLAAKAYELFNAEIADSGLKINTPNTILNIRKQEVPFWIERFGGHAVIKNPYSNAGQGVYTITSQKELNDFMQSNHDCDQFIIQSLIGNFLWSSRDEKGTFYQVGTIPDKKQNIYTADIRFMIANTQKGFKPVAICARRAPKPLPELLQDNICSWEVLGTNLSVKLSEDKWRSDSSRLIIMDRKDFNSLGLGLDHIIEAYIQTVLSTIAIDKMAKKLLTKENLFNHRFFSSITADKKLLEEIKLFL